jgi:hypothetical protein
LTFHTVERLKFNNDDDDDDDDDNDDEVAFLPMANEFLVR